MYLCLHNLRTFSSISYWWKSVTANLFTFWIYPKSKMLLLNCQLRQIPFPVVWSACAPIKWHPLDKSQMGVDSTWHIYLFTNTVYRIVIVKKHIWRNEYAKEEYISILAMWDLCKYHDLSRPPCPNSALLSQR